MVLDKKLKVMVWNPRSEDLWGLRSDEVTGQSVFELDIGLPVDQLREPLTNFLNDGKSTKQLTLDATNRRGKTIKCDVIITSLIGPRKESEGLVLMLEEK